MIGKLRHLSAGALVLCAGTALAPLVALAQSDAMVPGSWEEMALSVGPASSRQGYYRNAPMFGVRIGGALRVSTHAALRFDAQGAKTFSGTERCTNIAFGGAGSCTPGMGTLSGGTLGFGYIDTDARGLPRNFVSIAPGAFRISGNWSDTGGTGFGFRATLEHRLQSAASGALVFGIGVRAVLNVHHDTIVEIPFELGGWSW